MNTAYIKHSSMVFFSLYLFTLFLSCDSGYTVCVYLEMNISYQSVILITGHKTKSQAVHFITALYSRSGVSCWLAPVIALR